MPIPVHRHFWYFDKDIIDSALIDIEGMIRDKIVESTEKVKGHSGTIGVTPLNVGGKDEEKITEQISRQISDTDAGKFQRLYYCWEQEDNFTPLETLTSEDWDSLTRNQFIEVPVNISFSKITQWASTMETLTSWTGLIERFKGTILPEKEKIEITEKAFQLLKKQEMEKGLPIIMSIPSSKIKFIAYLKPNYLKLAKEQWIGETTVFCKIQTKIQPGKTHTLFDYSEDLTKIVSYIPQNRHDRRKQEQTKTQAPKDLMDIVKGPAAIVLPMAIYN